MEKRPTFGPSKRQLLFTDHQMGMRDYVTDGKILKRSDKGILLSKYVILLCFLMVLVFTLILWVFQFDDSLNP